MPKSPTGVAIGYALGNRAALSCYAEAGFLPIDNSASERALRAVAAGQAESSRAALLRRAVAAPPTNFSSRDAGVGSAVPCNGALGTMGPATPQHSARGSPPADRGGRPLPVDPAVTRSADATTPTARDEGGR